MLTKTQFETMLDALVNELGLIVTRDADKAGKESLTIRTETDEALKFLRDPKVTRGQALTTSYGLVDEFVRANWDRLVDELFAEVVKKADKSTSK